MPLVSTVLALSSALVSGMGHDDESAPIPGAYLTSPYMTHAGFMNEQVQRAVTTNTAEVEASWPITLPEGPSSSGYDEQWANNVIRSQNDSGPAKVRRRGTSAPEVFALNFEMTGVQVSVLKTFFDDTLRHGVLVFDMLHPRTKILTNFRFLAPPAIASVGGDEYVVRISLEVVP